MLVKFSDQEYEISPAEYAEIDWGSSADDFVKFNTVAGGFVVVNLRSVTVIQIVGHHAPSTPDPVYDVDVAHRSGYRIDQATRDTVVATLNEPLAEDIILEFSSVDGDDIKIVTANVTDISIIDSSFPEP